MCLYVLTSCVFESATAWRVGFCPFSEQVPPPSTNFLQATRFFSAWRAKCGNVCKGIYWDISLGSTHNVYIYIYVSIYIYIIIAVFYICRKVRYLMEI